MPIGQSSIVKSIAQSSIRATSAAFARQSTELVLSAASAYIGAIRGLGWSPSVDQEARCAVGCLTPGREFVVIDAGANVGNWAVAFRKHVAAKGCIYALEPQPQAAGTIRGLNVDNCEVLEVALGDRSGKKVFYTSGNADSMASLYERHDTFVKAREYSSIEVDVVRLDDLVKSQQINRIDFMKMDLEGAEFDALKGAANCMRTGMLQAFSFEFGISNVNSRVFFRDIFHLLSENQYRLFRITAAGRLVHVGAYSEDHEYFARTTTYLAKHKYLPS